ncbi:MAG: TonB-dependent receptor [Hyphomonadaceae bacterium]|nr:TonB-dependent receptor [Hyphomonadaceae bacterium]
MSGAAYAQTSPNAALPGEADCTPTPQCAAALPPTSSDRVAYDAGFFSRFNPQTALDMVRQTPGFSLDGGDDRRGFSGAVGNLLIDGLRPTAKNQSLDTILSQIPASQVVRVEVLRGDATAGDASGRAVLLNVVRTPNAGSGVWGTGFEYTSREVVAPRANISYSGRNGNVEWGLGGSMLTQARSLPGWRRYYDGTNTYFEFVDTPQPRNLGEAQINGNIAFPLAGGRLGLRGQVSGFSYDNNSAFFSFTPAGGALGDLVSDFEEGRADYEFGANYDRDFGPWALELVSLLNRRAYESDETVTTRDAAGAVTAIITQAQERDSGETILRAAMSRRLGEAHRIEFGAEGAFNSLDASLELTRDIGAGATPLTIPNANVLVEEERAEFFAVHSWRLGPNWALDTRLAWETSTLTFTGDANQSVDLNYFKPSIQLTRTFGGNNQLRARVYRDIGQLDFDDFVSATAIADSLINGGNPDLAPQTSWRAELGADLRFPGGAALGLTLTHHWISDVADLVLIVAPGANPGDPPIRFDAPGNIGDGEATSLDVTFNTPVPFVPGARVSIRGYLWETEVTDPVTGQPRIISRRPESELNVEFRQDFPQHRLAWGVNFFKQGEFQVYRFNEVDTSEEGPWIDVFVETTALPNNMRLRLWAANAFDGTVNRERRFFAPDRTGPLVRREDRERFFERAPWVIVQLSGTF